MGILKNKYEKFIHFNLLGMDPYGRAFSCTSLKNSQIKGAERFIEKICIQE